MYVFSVCIMCDIIIIAEILLNSGQLDQYCTDIADTATWGGQLEVCTIHTTVPVHVNSECICTCYDVKWMLYTCSQTIWWR